MNNEKSIITVYVTKYALTDGIKQIEKLETLQF